ncbi:MAG TPA: hypothetical protein VME22_15020 [Solirubrobacteraceae bacterium]|nr:hypothetical protein [Solirubrobacteraceae bacterium]
MGAVAGCGSSGHHTTATTAAAPAAITAAAPASPAPASPAPPAALLAEARPIGRGVRFEPPVRGRPIGDCTRSLGPRAGVHVEVFGANRVVLIPAGVGVRGPRSFSAGRIASASCYGDLVTLDPTGLVLIRPGAQLTLADLFRSWGQPLSAHQVASFTTGPGSAVRVFIDGRPRPGQPASVPLDRHAEIVLEVGPYVPPHHAYAFPTGT